MLSILTQNGEIFPESFIKNNVTDNKVFQSFIKTMCFYILCIPVQSYPMLTWNLDSGVQTDQLDPILDSEYPTEPKLRFKALGSFWFTKPIFGLNPILNYFWSQSNLVYFTLRAQPLMNAKIGSTQSCYTKSRIMFDCIISNLMISNI